MSRLARVRCSPFIFLGRPKRTPRLFASTRPAPVRSRIRSRSNSAIPTATLPPSNQWRQTVASLPDWTIIGRSNSIPKSIATSTTDTLLACTAVSRSDQPQPTCISNVRSKASKDGSPWDVRLPANDKSVLSTTRFPEAVGPGVTGRWSNCLLRRLRRIFRRIVRRRDSDRSCSLLCTPLKACVLQA